MALDPNRYCLGRAEHRAIFESRIKRFCLRNATPAKHPVAIIFGGQPGAGKSATVEAAKNELIPRGGAVEIIGDDLRTFQPHYARLLEEDDKTAAFYTDRDTGLWVEMLIDAAKARRTNIVIEGTMRDHAKVAATLKGLRTAGYQTEARILAVNPRLSEQGILHRYEKQKLAMGFGRMTTPEAHQAALDGMLATVTRIEEDRLADRVTVCRRGNVVIYSNEFSEGEWMHEPRAAAVIMEERGRSMTLEEMRGYVQGFGELARMLARPERQASAEERRRVDDLRRQASAEERRLVDHLRWQAHIERTVRRMEAIKRAAKMAKETPSEGTPPLP